MKELCADKGWLHVRSLAKGKGWHMNESNNAIYDKQIKHAQIYRTFHESELHWLRLILDNTNLHDFVDDTLM